MRIPAAHQQLEHRIRFDWGLSGALAVAQGVDVAVVVDVLSFTTTVSVAVDAGAAVLPYPWRDPTADAFAQQHAARLAVGRAQAGSGEVGLSPASMRAHAGPGDAIVLPSPNGAMIAHRLMNDSSVCVASALRNARAVAVWVDRNLPVDGTVAVVAAGELWDDGALRPAAEDLWGAGALVGALHGLGRRGLSPEAQLARASYVGVRDVRDALRRCASGLELIAAGFAADVDIAAEVDASVVVPVLRAGRFVDATAGR